MAEFAVIVQNDESSWDDSKGDLYHFPARYQSILEPGCKIIYYKGRMTNPAYAESRPSTDPHYFGAGIIGESIEDPESTKDDRYCEILHYQEFLQPIPIKLDGSYLEEIPESKRTNYWRYGVREIDEFVYARILALADLRPYSPSLPIDQHELESYEQIEGTKKVRYSSYYERIPLYRARAIQIHGLSCMACGFNFEHVYGELGKGFIHVHHNRPVSLSGPTRISPQTDLSVLCPNCHFMVHRKKSRTLSVAELKSILKGSDRIAV